MRSIPEATPIFLKVEERTELEVLARSMKAEHRKRQRARIVLMAGDGAATREIALQPPASAAHPVRQGRAVDIDPVAGKDLGLTIERGMVAVLADQHVGQQRGARQSLGDGTLGCRRLVDRAAGAAAIFGAANAQHPQACRHKVEHLADGLADGMERALATGADGTVDAEFDILARQMAGEAITAGLSDRIEAGWRSGWSTCLDMRDIGVEIFQAEGQLIVIDLFGASPNCVRCSRAMISRSLSISAFVLASSARSPVICAARSRTRACSAPTGSVVRSRFTLRV
jgi:hypothetical protein